MVDQYTYKFKAIKDKEGMNSIDMGTTAGVLNINIDNKITLVQLRELYYYLRGSLHCVLMSKYF